jgi:hypothetical protein
LITLNLSFASVSEMQAALHEMLHGRPAPVVYVAPPAPVAEQEAPKAAKPVKAAKVVEAPKPAPAAAESPAPTQPVSETATSATTASVESAPASVSPSEISYDVVQRAITNKAKTDRDTAVAVLAKFGVKKGTELKPEQYAEILAELA